MPIKADLMHYLKFVVAKLKSRKLRLACAAAALLLAVGLGFLVFGGSSRVEYLTDLARVGNIEQRVVATGQISAVQQVDVGAQVSGQIEKLHVVLGQEVKKGDLVAEIDSTTQENDLETNKARLETYEAQLNSRKISLKIARTKYERERRLIAKDATSSDKLEDAQNELAAAEAAVAEMESLIRQTRIAVNTAEVNLGYTKISSPLDGVVVSVAVEEGQTVNANQTTPTIVKIADLSQMEVKIEISEGDVTKLKEGMAVSFTILSEPDVVYETTLKSIDPGMTTLTDNKITETADTTSAIYYYGKLVVPNERGVLRIGMTTHNTIVIGSVRDALIVPAMAVEYEGGKARVKVLDGGRVVVREVKTGLSDNLNIQIVSGLEEGEEVILATMSQSEADSSVSGARAPRMRI